MGIMWDKEIVLRSYVLSEDQWCIMSGSKHVSHLTFDQFLEYLEVHILKVQLQELEMFVYGVSSQVTSAFKWLSAKDADLGINQ